MKYDTHKNDRSFSDIPLTLSCILHIFKSDSRNIYLNSTMHIFMDACTAWMVSILYLMKCNSIKNL